MNVDPYILAFSAVTVIVTIWMGFRSAKTSKTASDFFVAGRSVSVGWNASAISGEYLSAASFMGIAGMVMSSGYDALWYPVCYACGYLFLLLFIAGPLRRFGAYTIPDFAEGRFDSPLFRKIAVVFVLFIGFFYTMPQMKGAGTTLAYIFPGLPYWAGVVLVGAVITLNVALGGMKGITLVQAFQYWAKMFAISVPIFVLMAVYGHYGKQLEQNSSELLSPDVQFTPEAKPTLIESSFLRDKKSLNSFAEQVLGEDNARLFNLANERMTGTHLKDGEIKIERLLDFYSGVTSKRVTAYTVSDVLSQKIPWTTKTISGDAFIAAVKSALTNAGFYSWEMKEALIVAESNAVRSFSAKKALPEKAPADATWLSPFGPLTTKAAKASAATPLGTNQTATPRLKAGTHLEFITVFQGPSGMGRVVGEAKEVWHQRVTKDWGTGVSSAFGSETNSVYRLLDTYAQDRWCTVLRAAELTDAIVRVPTNIYPQGKFGEMIERVLATNGVILLHEANELVKAIPAAMVEISAPATVISAAQIRPYALLYTYSLIIALVCGTAGLPHILVRFYTNPDGVAAKRTTMWVMILIGIFYVFPPVFGVMGRNLMPELYTGLSGIKGTDQVVLKLPTLLNEKFGVLGSILSGVTCAGAFAAFMSTFSGLLVSMTGAMAHDVYGRILKPRATAEERLRMFKIAAVLIGGVAILLGSFVEPLEINFMVGQAFAIAAASYFPLLFMSVWWRGMTMKGAAIGMLTGGLCALIAATLTNVSNLALDKGPMGRIFAGFAGMNDFWAHHPLLRILCEQPAIWTVPLAIGLMIVVSKATRKGVPSDVRMKMLVLHAPEKLGLKQEYIQEHQTGH